MTNEDRRRIIEEAKAKGYTGSYVELFRQAEMGGGDISIDQGIPTATTPEQREDGLRPYHDAGRTDASMAFPDVPPNTPFNTVGMKAPIDIKKYDEQGHLVKSYESVPPGVLNLNTGPSHGTVIETPARKRMQEGDFTDSKEPAVENSPQISEQDREDFLNWSGYGERQIQKGNQVWVSRSGSDYFNPLDPENQLNIIESSQIPQDYGENEGDVFPVDPEGIPTWLNVGVAEVAASNPIMDRNFEKDAEGNYIKPDKFTSPDQERYWNAYKNLGSQGVFDMQRMVSGVRAGRDEFARKYGLPAMGVVGALATGGTSLGATGGGGMLSTGLGWGGRALTWGGNAMRTLASSPISNPITGSAITVGGVPITGGMVWGSGWAADALTNPNRLLSIPERVENEDYWGAAGQALWGGLDLMGLGVYGSPAKGMANTPLYTPDKFVKPPTGGGGAAASAKSSWWPNMFKRSNLVTGRKPAIDMPQDVKNPGGLLFNIDKVAKPASKYYAKLLQGRGKTAEDAADIALNKYNATMDWLQKAPLLRSKTSANLAAMDEGSEFVRNWYKNPLTWKHYDNVAKELEPTLQLNRKNIASVHNLEDLSTATHNLKTWDNLVTERTRLIQDELVKSHGMTDQYAKALATDYMTASNRGIPFAKAKLDQSTMLPQGWDPMKTLSPRYNPKSPYTQQVWDKAEAAENAISSAGIGQSTWKRLQGQAHDAYYYVNQQHYPTRPETTTYSNYSLVDRYSDRIARGINAPNVKPLPHPTNEFLGVYYPNSSLYSSSVRNQPFVARGPVLGGNPTSVGRTAAHEAEHYVHANFYKDADLSTIALTDELSKGVRPKYSGVTKSSEYRDIVKGKDVGPYYASSMEMAARAMEMRQAISKAEFTGYKGAPGIKFTKAYSPEDLHKIQTGDWSMLSPYHKEQLVYSLQSRVGAGGNLGRIMRGNATYNYPQMIEDTQRILKFGAVGGIGLGTGYMQMYGGGTESSSDL